MSESIAIVGMSLRVPGAATPNAFWNNLAAGVESIVTLSDEQLAVAGVSREAMQRPGYVRRAATLDRMEWFDAEFFGFSPKDAAIMDPQHRQFLGACWEALEDAAHPPSTFDGSIGVFAGCGMGSYFAFNLLSNRQLVDEVGMFLLRHTGNDKDFLVTRASYLLDLQGPAVNVQTACSTSLVATHLAVQNLLSGECDLALAGGVTIEIPHGRGYQYQSGEILSPDGHCRAFDADAAGTVFGSGVGVVVLRRLSEAVADGDHIYAVVRGTAINNDGARKVGYLAPSIDGQAACIAEALAVADVAATSVQLVECHGTGTAMGDPIEIAALDQAFGRPTDGVPYCQIGSVKTNIGHLDTAAGAASLIKASLALHHQAIPPSLHFQRPSPNSVLEGSAFRVATELTTWPAANAPRRAGVNSLGVGGTNAFAVLEEAPARAASTAAVGAQLLVLSARNRAALDDASERLARHLDEHPDLNLADVAYTLHAGRHQFAERRVVAASSVAEAARLLRSGDPRRVFTHSAGSRRPPVIFLFPGGGTQYPQMGAQLYASQPTFRRHVDDGLRLAQELHGVDLRPLLLADHDENADGAVALHDPSLQLPALLIIEHALAQLLISRGVVPAALAGHSVGECVAACIAGTMTFADCLGLIVLRGKLMDRTRGGMLSVRMSAGELKPILDECGLDLGVINAPDLCVASGTEAGLVALEGRLEQLGVEFSRVRINIAAHSRLLDPVLEEFRAYLKTITLSAPNIAWVSNQTGTWVTPAEATDPEYWVRQLRSTVDFAANIAAVAHEHTDALFVEVGPGTTLCSLARLNPAVGARHGTVHTMRQADEAVDDSTMLLTALGRLWAYGTEYPTAHAYGAGTRHRLSLPTYAFQEQRYFIEARSDDRSDSSEAAGLERAPADQWFWEPVWRAHSVAEPTGDAMTYLVFADVVGIADNVVARLRAAGHRVAVVRAGDSYRMIRADDYLLAAEHGRSGYEQLLADLVRTGYVPDRVLNLALLAVRPDFRPGHSFFHRNQELGFYNLVFFMQAWAAEGLRRPLHLVVATAHAQKAAAGDTVTWPEQATVLGPLLVLPHELPDLTCVAVDLSLPTPKRRSKPDYASVVDALVVEAEAPQAGVAATEVAAWRNGARLVRTYQRATVGTARPFPLRRGGVVLITGGLGGIGLTIARQLHEAHNARLVLATRTTLPPEEQWPELTRTLAADHPLLARITGLQALRAAGADVTVVQADVTNIAQMSDAIAKIRATRGGLHGVVHAAGVVDDRPLLEKEHVDIERVLAAKVYGTLVLDELTGNEPLDHFVVFSSTSAITGPAGQLDYVAANAFLDAFAQARPGRVTSIAWGAWSEVGMAVESIHRLLDDGHQRAQPCVGPLFCTCVTDAAGEVTLSASWSSDAWFLNEHRAAGGAAMFPGAGYVELARQALREAGVHRPFELRELVMIAPLAAATTGPTRVEATLSPTDYGYSLQVRRMVAADVNVVDEPKWATTAQAQVVLRSPAIGPAVDVSLALSQTPNRGAIRIRQQDHLRLGPRWNVAQSMQSGPQQSVAVLEIPAEYVSDLDGFPLHPALVDIGLCFAIEQVPGYTGDALWVPISAQSIVVHDPDGPADQLRRATVLATIRPGSSEAAGFATFDVVFVDAAGRVALTVTGFTMKRLAGRLNLSPLPNETVAESSAAHRRPATAAEDALRHNVSQGIRADEGAAAFELALTRYSGSQLVISALDPLALAAQTDRISSSALHSGVDSGVTFARPRLNSAYVAPRDALERTLTELWQELLGIDEVGLHDSFFDLGGHSLIAVRLFARIRKLFTVDLPISALFTADTVEAGAALIRSMLPTTDSAGAKPTTLPSQYTYLVPMHSRAERGTTPFFLVAGMFGNVLNLRHLSNQIGTDRPFYGLQARGLFGGDKPHETFEEMAAAYLQEVRDVQPHGPYLLGGFSGGGITALEMARQLRAAGEHVSLLAMLDTPAPSMRQPLTAADKIAILLQNIARHKFGYVGRWWRSRQDWRREVAERQQVPAPELGMQHSVDIEAAFLRALASYDVGRYDGDITLYRPPHRIEYRLPGHRGIDVRRDFVQDDNGWRRHCAHVEVVNVPGDHDSMVLEPHVRVLAEAIRHAIEAAEQ
ncbi:MAG: SDR family NAD(P)-dependent oxidoreductase [Actinomycetia bacterium]|nr:SDR family NAD(P)-dependent oxidoreductase [Actinomycetes bacterium]